MNNNSKHLHIPLRDFWSVDTYDTDFFSYTTATTNISKSKQSIHRTSGQLSIVSGANSSNCVGGNLLIETGKKLYPVRNPGVKRHMVSVIDLANNRHGYIDPESPSFISITKPIELPLKSQKSYDAAHIRQILSVNYTS